MNINDTVKIPNVDASRDVQTLIVNVRIIYIVYPSEFTEFDIGYVYNNMETSTDKKGTPLRKQDTAAL